MPRPTFQKPKSATLSRYEQLRDLRLAVQLRAEQVKLRRLEWDTQKLALPQITPLPGDGPLQRRRALTEADLPHPRPPVEMPEYKPGMSYEAYEVLIGLYMDERKAEERRDPYNALASVTAQAILEAAQAREDARLEKEKDRERAKRDAAAKAKARADAKAEAEEQQRNRWR